MDIKEVNGYCIMDSKHLTMLSEIMFCLSLGAIALAQLPSIPGVCPSEADRKILFPDPVLPAGLIEKCGQEDWREVMNIDVTSHECPPNWNLLIISPHRLCENNENRSSLIVDVGFAYSRVCGRVTGFTLDTLSAFGRGIVSPTPDDFYFDGVRVSYGPLGNRTHVWSFAVGANVGSIVGEANCPCDNSEAPQPPAFVQNNFFCDSSINGFLWDEENCINECCTFHSPPWFNAALESTITNDLEVAIVENLQFPTIFIQKVNIFVS